MAARNRPPASPLSWRDLENSIARSARRGNFVCFYDRSARPIRLVSKGAARKDAGRASFFDLFDAHSRAKAATLWKTVLAESAVVDWALHLYSENSAPTAARVCGVVSGDDVLVIAVPDDARTAQGQRYDDFSGIINELSAAHRQTAQNAKMLHLSHSHLQFLARSAAACARHLEDVDVLLREAFAEALPVLGPHASIDFRSEFAAPVQRLFNADGRDAVVTLAPPSGPVKAAVAERATTMLCLPLDLRKDRVGEICFGREKPGYSEGERALAEQFANIVAVALDNALRYANERSVSEQLQRASLPQALPESALFDVGAAYIVSGKDLRFIGGDWYDAFILPDGDLALCVGDVTGHGLRAATTMAKIRSAVRSAALNASDPVEVLMRVHQFLLFENIFATAIYARVNLTTLECAYAIAGHPPPVIVRDAHVSLLQPGGTPLGLALEGSTRPDFCTVPLQRGDRITFYTDGLVEATRDINEGLARLVAAAGACSTTGSAQENVAAIVERVLGSSGASDDVAALQVHFK